MWVAYQLALGQQFGHPKQLTSTLQGTCANAALVVCQHPQGYVLTTGCSKFPQVTNSIMLSVCLLFEWALSTLVCILGLFIFLGFQHFPKFKGTLSVSSKVHACINAFLKIALLEIALLM